MLDLGWTDLTNARATLEVAGSSRSSSSGVDDPHLNYDRYGAVAGPSSPDGRADGRASPTRRTSGCSTRWPATAPS